MRLNFVLRLLCALLLLPVSTATRTLQDAEVQRHTDTDELTDDREGDSSSGHYCCCCGGTVQTKQTRCFEEGCGYKHKHSCHNPGISCSKWAGF
ncbi:unnamed protein product [Effrenium voratum]|nr:unnamed protein product [Effrenium voratum]